MYSQAVYIKIFCFLAFSVLFISCTRKSEESSLLTIQFPDVIAESKLEAAAITTSANGTTSWLYAAPTSLADIKCYGIAISGRENNNSKKCYDVNGNIKFETQFLMAAIPAGGSIEVEVLSGPNRQIKVFGFNAVSAADCTDFKVNVPFSKLSAPHVLSEMQIDLEPGSVTVPVTMLVDPNNKFEECTDSFDLPRARLSFDTGPTYNFGNAFQNQAIFKQIILTNNGDAAATNLAATTISGASFTFAGVSSVYPGIAGTCSAVLLPGQSCTMNIKYLPVNAGSESGSMALSFVDQGGSNTIVLSLTGNVPPAFLVATPPAYTFPNIAYVSTYAESIVVTNTGSANANFTGATGNTTQLHFLGGAYPGTGGTCGAVIPFGSSCNLRFEFSPLAINTFSTTILVQYNNGISTAAPLLINLTGTGI